MYFGGAGEWLGVPVAGRGALSVRPQPGPLIIEEYDTTVVVPAESTAVTDELGNVVLESARR